MHAERNVTFTDHFKKTVGQEYTYLFVAYVLIATCVFILNPVTIVAILRTASLRRCHSNIFLLNLAIVDLLIMGLLITFLIESRVDVYGLVLCVTSLVYLGTVSMSSLLFCFAIAVDRFLYIHKALTYSTLVTRTRVLKIVASVWIFSLLTALVPLMDGEIVLSGCLTHSSITVIIHSYMIFTLFCLTAVVSVCLYTKLFFIIRDHNKVLESHARVHANCHNHSCKITTRLGECRLRHNSQSQSLTRTTAEKRTPEDPTEKKSLVSNTIDYSITSSMSRDNTMLRFDDEDLGISVIKASCNSVYKIKPKDDLQECIDNNKCCTHSSKPRNRFLYLLQRVKSAATTREHRLGKCQHLRDLRTVKTLMMMFAIYFICWAPLMTMKAYLHIFMQPVSLEWITSAWIAAMSNSVWNFMVYPLRKKDLRVAIFSLFRRCFRIKTEDRKQRHSRPRGGSDSLQGSLRLSASTSQFHSGKLYV